MKVIFAVMVGIAVSLSGGAMAAEQPHISKYSGQEKRELKALSAGDIAELRRGGGWGLAKPAELNGLPGPAHLLELKDKIPLSADQSAAIASIYDSMKSQAIVHGEKLIALERQLDQHFARRTITDDLLRSLLGEIAAARRQLRYIHLSTHLKTPAILSAAQIKKYNALRGYSDDPCAKIPTGHDPVQWRKHNVCG
jgi:hypothetical protein